MRCDKVLMMIFDGMPDRPIKALDMRTPLQAAKTPGLDRAVADGAGGIMHVIAPGVVPGSDTAHLSLFGYNPYKYYSGRGPFEAAGVGIDCLPGDIAFRCNFATIDDKMRVIDRRAGRIREGTEQLAKSISGMKLDGIEVILKEATEHRAVLILRGDGLDSRVTDVDPHEENSVIHKCRPLAPEADLTSEIVNRVVREGYKILMKHPINLERASRGLPIANIILPRGAGKLRKLESFESRYGLKAGGIAGVSLIKGVFRVLGFNLINVKGATGGIDTDMAAKAEAALKNLGSHDFIGLNIKAPDIAGHDGDHALKVKIIEEIDTVVSKLLKDIPDDVLLILLSDHSTPVSLRNHSADPVCIAMHGHGVRIDRVEKFDEISCSTGILSGMKGVDLIPITLGIMGRAEKYGS